ncbi:hypothetical protein [Roseovarius sp. Pro17]|uniref:hypothetical protein n=1 Tax=Roseovarius sp. Pro17 TaxID=3108175 RepID=UPI002D76C44D|nr:hypothetical protein [Roseovarius sp. Pro17]
MRQFFIPIAIAASLAAPVHAQDLEAPSDGASMIEDGARMFFEGLLQEARPAMRDMRELADRLGPQLRSFAEEMGPALADILKDVEDLSVYAAPEKLPNGDIIIRRKEPLEPVPQPERPDLLAPDTGDEIEI